MVTFQQFSPYCPCAVVTVYIPASPPLSIRLASFIGPSQGIEEGLRHEAAQQV